MIFENLKSPVIKTRLIYTTKNVLNMKDAVIVKKLNKMLFFAVNVFRYIFAVDFMHTDKKRIKR